MNFFKTPLIRNLYIFFVILFVFIFLIVLLFFFIAMLTRYPNQWLFFVPAFKKYTEGFSNSIESIIIHLPSSDNERKQNIMNLKQKIYDAVDGSTIDINKLSHLDSKLNIVHKSERGVGEYGCYLSHFMVIKNIVTSQKHTGYTIVFEDDANIISDDFQEDIMNIISSVNDFDIIFLGNLNENRGTKYNNNIYYVDKNEHLWGTHAYIVNNQSAEKIYGELLTMHTQIDNQYKNLVDTGKLKGFVIHPILVEQSKYSSTIELPAQ